MLDVFQWPALAVTAVAVWLIATEGRPRRFWGFLFGLVATGLWAAWAWNAGAWGVAAAQAVLAVALGRGAVRSRAPVAEPSDQEREAFESARSRRPDADFAALVREAEASRPADRRRVA